MGIWISTIVALVGFSGGALKYPKILDPESELPESVFSKAAGIFRAFLDIQRTK